MISDKVCGPARYPEQSVDSLCLQDGDGQRQKHGDGNACGWPILNKVTDTATCFSDVVLVVCPNVTIRSRLGEINPEQGDASLYRTRDLVPEALMPHLRQGRPAHY